MIKVGGPVAEMLDQIHAPVLYRSGKTLKQIGGIVGCSHTWVALYLRQAGVEIRPRNSRKILQPIASAFREEQTTGYDSVRPDDEERDSL